jgi:hypothetical protein
MVCLVLALRLQTLEADVERTQFVHIVRTLELAVASEAIVLDARGDAAGLRALAGSNPMALLRPPPANYRGEIDGKTPGAEIPGSWGFDLRSRELVYVPRVARDSSSASTSHVVARFKLRATQTDDESARYEPERTGDHALRLVAVEVPPWLDDPDAAPRMLP